MAATITGCAPPRSSGEAPLADPPSPENTNSVPRIQGKLVAVQAPEEVAESRMLLSELRAELPEIAVPTNSVKIPVETFGPEIMDAIAAGKSEEEIMEMVYTEKCAEEVEEPMLLGVIAPPSSPDDVQEENE